MKPKFFLKLVTTGFFVALCSNPVSAQTASKKGTVSAKPTATELEEGKTLISKSDCLACHKLDLKLVGPAYKDVAKKYPATAANYNLLSQKIVKGGAGNWGTIPMSPHPSLKVDEVNKMVKYILSIK